MILLLPFFTKSKEYFSPCSFLAPWLAIYFLRWPGLRIPTFFVKEVLSTYRGWLILSTSWTESTQTHDPCMSLHVSLTELIHVKITPCIHGSLIVDCTVDASNPSWFIFMVPQPAWHPRVSQYLYFQYPEQMLEKDHTHNAFAKKQ